MSASFKFCLGTKSLAEYSCRLNQIFFSFYHVLSTISHLRETSKCEFLTGTSRQDAPVNSIGGGRRQCADFVFHAVAFRLRNQSGFKQNLIVVAQPELFSKLFLCLLRRRFPLGADAVHLLFCCKYSQRELESCSSSSPPPTSTSCPFAFLHGRPRRDRGRFSFAGASCGACCRCAAA